MIDFNRLHQSISQRTPYDWNIIYFFYYKFFIKNFKKNWNNINKINLNVQSPDNIYLEPVYTFNKQYLAKRTFFNDFLKLNNFEGIQIFNAKKKNFNYYGNVYYITKYKLGFDIPKTFEINDDTKPLFRLKHDFYPVKINVLEYNNCKMFYNLYVNDIKILYIIISLNIINKLNKKYI